MTTDNCIQLAILLAKCYLFIIIHMKSLYECLNHSGVTRKTDINGFSMPDCKSN